MDATQVKVPRLCIMKKEDSGYGFNLHGEKGVTGQYISAVDSGGAADKAGLCYGDRVIEVNGINVETLKHTAVVQHIRLHPTHAALLVIDPVTDKYLRSIGRPVTSDLVALKSVTELASDNNSTLDTTLETTMDNNDVNTCVDESLHCAGGEEEVEDNSQYYDEEIVKGEQDEECVGERENIHPDSEEKDMTLDESSDGKDDKGNEEENPYDYVTQYAKEEDKVDEQPAEAGASQNCVVDENTVVTPLPGEGNGDTKTLPGNLTLNIPVDKSKDNDLSSQSASHDELLEKIQAKIVPRPGPKRKEVKQGDWRAKKELFDLL